MNHDRTTWQIQRVVEGPGDTEGWANHGRPYEGGPSIVEAAFTRITGAWPKRTFRVLRIDHYTTRTEVASTDDRKAVADA